MFYSRINVLSPCIFIISVLAINLIGCNNTEDRKSHESSRYLQAVQSFADNVLKEGRDGYGDIHSPLFVDGINVKTKEPVRWEYGNHSWVISNFASQQNLMRVLVGLTELTGEPKYRKSAEEATKYMFKNESDSQGLLYWGGHQFVDLETMDNQFKDRPHELKNNYPFYEFMWEVDSASTKKMLKAIWNAHVLDWSVLDLNRHGEYDSELGDLWDHEFHQPEPFFEGDGLTFFNAGTDLIQVAISLYALDDDRKAETWGLRLYEQYVRARDPETGLGVYQYSQPRHKEQPPEGPLTGELTFSRYGDRAQNQFGKKYGEIALEGNVLWGRRVQTIYGQSAVMLLHLSEMLEGTEAGDHMLKWTLDGMKALITHAYVPEENHFKPMWADGTDLTGQVFPRTGYYGKKGTEFPFIEPDGSMMIAYAKAVRLSDGDVSLWKIMKQMFNKEGLGNPGSNFGGESSLNMQTAAADPKTLVAVLELYRATQQNEFLQLAERIGDNILKKHFQNGYFRPTPKHVYTKFDSPEPLALLMLEAARQGKPDAVPPYLTGSGETDGEPQKGGRPSDENFYEETY